MNTEINIIDADVDEVIASSKEVITNEEVVTDEVVEVKTRGRKPKNKQYFTKDTENAILLYNQLENDYERNKIYDAEIKYPFDKLVENIIHTFKFYHFDVPYEDVKHEVVAFLNEKIHKYTDPNKGKAFSYFSIIAKNYLIIHNNGNYNKFKNTEQPEVIDDRRNVINEVLREEDVQEKSEFMDLFIKYMDDNLSSMFKKQADMSVADSVLELFRNRENIENFNKKALYILIRDRTGVKTQYITRVVNTMKNAYMEMYGNYKKTGFATINQAKFKKSEFLE
jgi:hypothetical protein